NGAHPNTSARLTSLAPQGGEGLRVRGGAAKTFPFCRFCRSLVALWLNSHSIRCLLLGTAREQRMQHHFCSRRSFLRVSTTAALAAPFTSLFGLNAFGAAARTDTNVAIVPCKTYGAELPIALEKGFDLIRSEE